MQTIMIAGGVGFVLGVLAVVGFVWLSLYLMSSPGHYR